MIKLALCYFLTLGARAASVHGASSTGENHVVILRDGLTPSDIQEHHARVHGHLESLDTLIKRQVEDSQVPSFRDSKSTIGDVHFHAYEVRVTPELARIIARDPAVALVERDSENEGERRKDSTGCKANRERSEQPLDLDSLIQDTFDGFVAPEPTVRLDASAVSSAFAAIPTKEDRPNMLQAPYIQSLMKPEESMKLRKRMDDIIKGRKLNVQHNAPWSLARLSHRKPANYSQDSQDYLYHATGKGHLAYVMDTGVRDTYVEFEGRLTWGADFVRSPSGAVNASVPGYRGHMHGTYVAGILAGKNVGVAKSAEVKLVRVVNAFGSSSLARFLRGVHWIIDDYVKNGKGRRAVISHSIEARPLEGFQTGIKYAVASGLLFVSGAGNNGDDACYSATGGIGQYVGKITVGSVRPDLTNRAAVTNYGRCVDVSYHGDDTYSATVSGDNDYESQSGTSFATPYVSGLALYLWELDPTLTLREISELIINSNPDVMRGDLTGTINRFAYNGADGFALPA